MSEAMPLPFLAPGDLARAGLSEDGITITNPLVAEESVLRTSLLPGLLKALAYNASHRNHGVGLFEIGHVYRPPATPQPLPDEREHLAVAQAGAEAPAAVDVLGVIVGVLGHEHELVAAELPGLHPTRSARIRVQGEDVGAVGEVDPDVLAGFGVPERVAWLELDLGWLLELPGAEHGYRSVSRFPSSDVDLAFEVDESVPAAAVERALRAANGELVVSVQLFDVYRGPGVADGSRSLAYRLRLQAPDRTLTDADVAAVRAQAIEAVQTAHAARLRA
jgi:phenylalanyl-tRNA synthetase beta chain